MSTAKEEEQKAHSFETLGLTFPSSTEGTVMARKQPHRSILEFDALECEDWQKMTSVVGVDFEDLDDQHEYLEPTDLPKVSLYQKPVSLSVRPATY